MTIPHALPLHANGVSLCLEELLAYEQQTVHFLPPARQIWSQRVGQHQSRRLGRGMDFSEVRQYQAGDDIRSIDWRVTARTGKPHTKLFSEERERTVVLYIDLSPSMQFGSCLLLKSVQAAHLASLLSWLAVKQQDRVGAVIDLGHRLIEIKPGSRQRGVLAILAACVEVQHIPPTQPTARTLALHEVLSTLNRLCPKGSEVVLISDFVDLDTEQHALSLRQLCRHNRVRLVQIHDPLEQGDTSFRGIEQVQNNQETRWLNFSINSTRAGIKKAFETQKEKLKSLCLLLEMDYRSVSSGIPLLQQLSDHKK
ncbi:TPA: DUF58 domain-containing protein [Vibrio cholerae]|uniref:DUF58 domain-containing protein n=1 Tax=Vibrio cholerae TaxID=666 RepID=UPI0001D5A783|nr:DUF58 domain-containing protein [Vibrio cholerae]EFH74179.1 conserved hypothetical protein [Vibrio cholerae RC385]EGR0741602.1 DUF58 domain-containing protein [Vibrio cholerae]EGR0756105.1 DUF58 domain-containing protein [Vibrio cholerae]EGR0819625.1 DUF58 domain-containing protein [Vibrio cholerae]EHD2269893.1 DUF58 domain-containing protein [Vibrio cholerae]